MNDEWELILSHSWLFVQWGSSIPFRGILEVVNRLSYPYCTNPFPIFISCRSLLLSGRAFLLNLTFWISTTRIPSDGPSPSKSMPFCPGWSSCGNSSIEWKQSQKRIRFSFQNDQLWLIGKYSPKCYQGKIKWMIWSIIYTCRCFILLMGCSRPHAYINTFISGQVHKDVSNACRKGTDSSKPE